MVGAGISKIYCDILYFNKENELLIVFREFVKEVLEVFSKFF